MPRVLKCGRFTFLLGKDEQLPKSFRLLVEEEAKVVDVDAERDCQLAGEFPDSEEGWAEAMEFAQRAGEGAGVGKLSPEQCSSCVPFTARPARGRRRKRAEEEEMPIVRQLREALGLTREELERELKKGK